MSGHELKRCPCCGSAAEFRCVQGEEDDNFGGEFIECIVCGLTTPLLFPAMDDVKPELAEKWNRRTAPDTPAQVAALVAAARREAFDDLVANCWDLRCVAWPNGGGDADVGWVVIEHHQALPKERKVGEGDTPDEAIAAAIRAAAATQEPRDAG